MPIRRLPTSWRHHAALAQVSEQREEGEAQDREVAAFDPVEQLHAGAFDPIAADAPADRFPFALQIVVEEGVAEVAHGEADGFASPPDRLTVHCDHGSGVKAVRGATKRSQLITGLVDRRGLGQDRPVVTLEDLVGAQDQVAGISGGRQRLELRQLLREAVRIEPGTDQTGLRLLLLQLRFGEAEGNAGRLEHRPPRRALRGEQQPHAASIRSLQRRTMAKAVSSIERRVTSITGQSLSANSRRAKASSAFTASRST